MKKTGERIVGLVLLILPIVCHFTFRSLLVMRAPGALLPYLLAHYLLMGAGLARWAWQNRSVPRWNTAWRRAARFCSISSSS